MDLKIKYFLNSGLSRWPTTQKLKSLAGKNQPPVKHNVKMAMKCDCHIHLKTFKMY